MSGTKNDQCMKGWYEIRGEDVYIWEGILALFHPALPILSAQLYKIMDGEIFEIQAEFSNCSKIKSDGYWKCVEISGVQSTGMHFLCHSLDVKHAKKILKVLPSAITSISIRLDPNPLRNWNRGKIEERLHNWRLLADQMCEFPENSKIILDPDMLS